MDIPWIRSVSQIGVYLTFLLYLGWALRRGAREWAPLLGAALYAVLFEHANMLRYAQSAGGYHYHTASWLWIWGDVPLYIPLAWAFILATSRAMTDHLPIRSWARPFSDALLALLIDASMDAVAIRLKFWYWHGVGLNDAFFGVPADNFVGWLLVTFTFSLMTRALWRAPSRPHAATAMAAKREDRHSAPKKAAVQLLLIPPCAYTLYLALEWLVHLQYTIFHTETLRAQLLVLAALLIVFVLVVLAARRPARDEAPVGACHDALRVHAPRHVFHIFGLVGLFWLPAGMLSAPLLALAATVWGIELLVALLAARNMRRSEHNED